MDRSLIVAVSDIHLGTDHRCAWYQRDLHEPYLAHLLQWVIDRADEVRELVLLGDIVDLWTYPADEVPPTFADIVGCHPAILGPHGLVVQALDALDGAVTYVPGNHDMGVTQADLDAIVSPGGRTVRLVDDVPYVAAPGVALAHGHHHTLFNAPAAGVPWAPLPLGYFVTRVVATRWARDLEPGQTVADLADQGAPNGIDLASLARVASGLGTGSVAAALVDFVAGATGVGLDEAITMPDGSTVTLREARTAHAGTWTDWAAAHGGGIVGHGYALRATLADFDGTCLGWFAQQTALEHDCDLVVMGHTHAPVGGLDEAMVDYVNSGFDCPSSPDLERELDPQHVTFAVIDWAEPAARVWAVQAGDAGLTCGPIDAPRTRVVVGRTADYSCYVELETDQAAGPLELVAHGAANGTYVVPPPERIEPGTPGRWWLQDLFGAAGSAGWATYRRVGARPDDERDDERADERAAEPIELRYACPTLGTNVATGTEEFATRVAGGRWRNERVIHWGHPFFVAYDVR